MHTKHRAVDMHRKGRRVLIPNAEKESLKFLFLDLDGAWEMFSVNMCKPYVNVS
jgi:hypothetical protein